MALKIEFFYHRPTIIEALISGLNTGYVYDDRYVVWEYKKSTSSKWTILTDDNGVVVETPIEAETTVSEKVTITDLYPDTEYNIRAMIYSYKGEVFTDEYITGSYWTLKAPVIDSFNVYDTSKGSLEFTWDFAYSDEYYGITEFEIQARPQGTEDWWTKISETLEEDGATHSVITVENYGSFEFRLILRTYEAEVVSDIVTATAYSEYDPPVIDSFSITEPEQGKLNIKWSLKCLQVYYGITGYEVWASKHGADDWWKKDEGVLYSEELTGEFTVDSFYQTGIDVKLILITAEYSTESAVKRAVPIPNPVNTSSFNAETTAGSLNVSLSWAVDWIYEDETVYHMYLYKETDDGKKKTAEFTGTCELSNTLNITVSDYGKYQVFIYYITGSYNNGNYYYSEWFSVSQYDIPLKWYWISPMEGQLAASETKEIHPVTAQEWSEFIGRLNDLRNCLEKFSMVFEDYPSSFTSVSPGMDFTPAIYNEAAAALRSLSYSAGEKYAINDIDGSTVLSASLFLNLQNQLNYLIDEI